MLGGAATPDAAGGERLTTLSNLCSAFVDDWKSGERPRIETLLDQVAATERMALLSRLIVLEVDCRRALGEAPAAEEYCARFPAKRALIDAVLLETDQTSQIFDSTHDIRLGGAPNSTADFAVAGQPEAAAFNEETSEALSRYERIELLGRGGFGEVWRVRDNRLGREVALKIPRPDKTFPPDVHRRFLAEARKVAALDSIPGVVRVLDVGTIESGFYIVMQWIEGETLSVRLFDKSRPALTHRESAQLIAELATVLDGVHRQKDGITHRDLKPQNILLDKLGRPHITDFGLAISESEQFDEGPSQQGTKAYLSPEQARFESNLVDGRSDIFSLGVIFYQMLTGVRPFSGRTGDKCVKAILECDPRPLRARDATIPRELERICLKCIEKRMSNRYLTAGNLAGELHAWLASTGARLAGPGSASALSSPHPGRRLHPGSIFALMAALLIPVAYFVIRPPLTPDTGTRAVLPERTQEATSVIVRSPANRTEQEFIKVFGRAPQRMSWEGKRGRGSHKFVDEVGLNALEISSDTVWLIELCEMPAGDFEFAIDLRQPSWTGRVGICLGKHLEERGAARRGFYAIRFNSCGCTCCRRFPI